jgi:hypothetical protein
VEHARLLAVDLDGQSSGVSWPTKPATRFSSSLSAKWAPSVQQPTSGASA